MARRFTGFGVESEGSEEENTRLVGNGARDPKRRTARTYFWDLWSRVTLGIQKKNGTVFIVGDAKVGKTSLIRRLNGGVFSDVYQPTREGAFSLLRLPSGPKALLIEKPDWRERNLPTGVLLAIIVFNPRVRDSFESVDGWAQAIRSFASSSSREVKIIIVGNMEEEENMEDQRMQVTTADASLKAEGLGALFVQTSAKEGTNVPYLLSMIRDSLRGPEPDLEQQLPAASEQELVACKSLGLQFAINENIRNTNGNGVQKLFLHLFVEGLGVLAICLCYGVYSKLDSACSALPPTPPPPAALNGQVLDKVKEMVEMMKRLEKWIVAIITYFTSRCFWARVVMIVIPLGYLLLLGAISATSKTSESFLIALAVASWLWGFIPTRLMGVPGIVWSIVLASYACVVIVASFTLEGLSWMKSLSFKQYSQARTLRDVYENQEQLSSKNGFSLCMRRVAVTLVVGVACPIVAYLLLRVSSH